ncbi:MAG: adenosylhomocysteinase [Bacteroidales bacterium]|nr:adenosylhomocysteinase [Bacteroidales bacterium]
MSEIKDVNLWPEGQRKIDWVRAHMPLLNDIEEQFSADKPFAGVKVAVSVHLEAKTAYLCQVLAAGGAEVYAAASNVLSTQDDVVAALVKSGVNVFAVHGESPEEYDRHIRCIVEAGPNVIIDDGGDIVSMIHSEYPQLIENVWGGCEETTTGINRLLARAQKGELKFPMVMVNNAECKYLFDNRYGTGQSVWDGIMRTTNLIVASKTVVVAGYGWCGKGVAMRAKGLGASVIVTEIDPIRAMEAVMDGFKVMTMDDAAPLGDLFITVTGCCDIVCERHFRAMKDGAICCNAGHFDVEVDVATLRKIATETKVARKNIEGFKVDGKWIYLLGEGRLVNLAAGDGHPAEIMDMSFAIQALSAAYIVRNKGMLPATMLVVPEEIDKFVARKKLAAWGVTIDTQTEKQKAYLES